jgi:hypothetical protein
MLTAILIINILIIINIGSAEVRRKRTLEKLDHMETRLRTMHNTLIDVLNNQVRNK